MLTPTMPETTSIVRRNVLKFFGANLIVKPGSEGMKEDIARAEDLAANGRSRRWNRYVARWGAAGPPAAVRVSFMLPLRNPSRSRATYL